MTDKVNHPSHYTSGPKCTCGRTIECIDVARGLGFTRGNAVKYLWRAGLKDSSPCVEDLRKAIWYIEDEINRLGGEKAPAKVSLPVVSLTRWVATDFTDPCGECVHSEEAVDGPHCEKCLEANDYPNWELYP